VKNNLLILISLLTVLLITVIPVLGDVIGKNSSVEPFNVNKSVRPGNDFFSYVNDAWMESHPIPGEKVDYTAFDALNDLSMEQVRSLLESSVPSKNSTQGNKTDLIRVFFRSGMDTQSINNKCFSPLNSSMKLIDSIETRDDLINATIALTETGVNPLYIYMSGQDPTNTTRVIPYMSQGGIGLPDRDYYFRDDNESVKMQQEYITYIKNLFILLNYTPDQANETARKIYGIEKQIAGSHLTNVENRDPKNTTNILNFTDLEEKYPGIGWSQLQSIPGSGFSPVIDINQPGFIAKLSELYTTLPLEDWKIFLKYKLVDSYSPYLSEPFVNESFNFYSKQLNGQKEMKPRWKRVIAAENYLLGMEIGKEYVDAYVDPSTKPQVKSMLANIKATLRERIKNLTWMENSTKQSALEKLDTMQEKIAYPDKWMDYSNLTLTSSYAENVMNASQYLFIYGPYGLSSIGKPVDRTTWDMNPQTVNAYYDPLKNEIVFPAGILQPPFFSPVVDSSVNYGGIGSIIGHEITHGFDDQGRQFDKNGTLSEWWTENDIKSYNNRTKLIEDRFNSFEVLPGLYVNGSLTLGENIADFGGLTISYYAWKRSMNSTEKVLMTDNFTPEQKFFLSFARVWRGSIRDEFLRTLTYSDVHPWNKFRINGAPFFTPEFYAAFPEISSNDTLYIQPSQRPVIW